MYLLGGLYVKHVAFTDFQKMAYSLITKVEYGETIILL
jgi:hypothetical protein